MKSTKILILILLYVSSSNAAFEKLFKGYLGSKIEIKNLIDRKITQNELSLSMASNPWQLTLSGSRLSNDLETANPFQGRGLVVDVYALALTKKTFGYGTFNFTHTDNDSDFSNFTVNPNGLSHIYEKRNSISYSFDFLDRSSSWDFEVNTYSNERSRIQNNVDQISNDASFMQAYLKAKFDLFNLRLEKDFVEKSKIRLKRISKMFKDGTVRKVDSLQARLKYKTDQRQVVQAKLELDRSLLKLEALIDKKIPNSELDKINWKFKPLSKFGELLKNNKIKDVELLLANIKQAEAENKSSLDKSGHKLSLELKYESNVLRESETELLEDSFQRAQGENRQVSLTYSIAFGSGYLEARNKSAYGQIKRLEMIKSIKEDELSSMFLELKRSLKTSESLILSLKQESSLAKIALRDMNKLYNRGQAAYSDVISSEETLLGIERQKFAYLYQYESSLVQFFAINGEIRNYMSSYKD